MNVGDLVECKLEIYGLGVVLSAADDSSLNRTTVQWLDPPKWLFTNTNRISSHKPRNLEKICK